jgi:hypothetical protein
MDEGLQTIHVLRTLEIGYFYHPASRLRFLQMMQEIV